VRPWVPLLLLVGCASRASRLPPPPPDLPVGAPLPALTLTDDRGAPFTFRSLVGAPAWLIFFRAASCPSCRAQLAAAAALGAIADVRLVALSPDPPERLAALRRELALPFVLVSDEDEQAVARSCAGLAHCQLLVARDGHIRWGGWTDSWARPPSPAALLEAARHLR
jgi:peroxiredoxin